MKEYTTRAGQELDNLIENAEKKGVSALKERTD
jgi:hypothetical protein